MHIKGKLYENFTRKMITYAKITPYLHNYCTHPRERKDVGESLAKRQTKTPPHPMYTERLKCPPKPKEKSSAPNQGPV